MEGATHTIANVEFNRRQHSHDNHIPNDSSRTDKFSHHPTGSIYPTLSPSQAFTVSNPCHPTNAFRISGPYASTPPA